MLCNGCDYFFGCKFIYINLYIYLHIKIYLFIYIKVISEMSKDKMHKANKKRKKEQPSILQKLVF